VIRESTGLFVVDGHDGFGQVIWHR